MNSPARRHSGAILFSAAILGTVPQTFRGAYIGTGDGHLAYQLQVTVHKPSWLLKILKNCHPLPCCDGIDVTVLQAWFGESVGTHDYVSLKVLDVAHCNVLEQHTYPGSATSHASTYVTADCAPQVEQLLALEGAGKASPLLTAFEYQFNKDEVTGQIYSTSGSCETLELRTVTRDSALASPVFNGIGFFFQSGDLTQGPAAGRFIARDRLHAVGHVTLADGAPATVHRFLARGMCMGQGGNGDSIYHRNFTFRPFAQYRVAAANDSSYYNIWDDVAADYRLGLSKYPSTAWTKSFDRQDELLQK